MSFRGLTVACSVLIVACSGHPPAEPNPLQVPPISIEVDVAEIAGWSVRDVAEGDLDGDGTPERVVLAADVTRSDRGVALWEDGHRWAVFVDEDTGADTLLYAAFVPNGKVEAATGIASSQRTREVFVLERTPQQVRTIVIAYEGAGRARSVSVAHYHIERWIRDITR